MTFNRFVAKELFAPSEQLIARIRSAHVGKRQAVRRRRLENRRVRADLAGAEWLEILAEIPGTTARGGSANDSMQATNS
jgi:hypothetical protein